MTDNTTTTWYELGSTDIIPIQVVKETTMYIWVKGWGPRTEKMAKKTIFDTKYRDINDAIADQHARMKNNVKDAERRFNGTKINLEKFEAKYGLSSNDAQTNTGHGS